MNNKEFYQKWGRSPTLKYLISTIIVCGMDAIKETAYRGDTHNLILDFNPNTYNKPLPGPLDIAECYHDLRQMPPGFIKNVIRKVL